MRALARGSLVPAVLMRHERLPVTDRGKVDVAALRTTLPVPWRVRPPRKSYSEVEHWIGEWSSIQGKEIGVANADGFFHVVIDEDEEAPGTPSDESEAAENR